MIKYFWEGLRPFIRAQLDIKDKDLDLWNEVVDKTVDAEAKTSLQTLSGTKKIVSQCLQGQQPTKKDDKGSRDFEKNKPSQNLIANTSSSSSGTQFSLAQLIKKDQNNCFCWVKLCCQGQSQDQNIPTIDINATAIRKNKNKDKKDLANIKYYNYKQKDHYTNKYPKKEPKN